MAAQKTQQSQMVEAFAHPLRLKILTALGSGPASPSELSERLAEPLHAVGYHMRRLVELNCVELAEERIQRGTIEHFYRRIERPKVTDQEAAQLSAEQRQEYVTVLLQDIWRDVLAALDEEGFSRRPDTHVSRSPLVFDEEGWEQLAERLVDVVKEAQDISAASLDRMQKRGEDPDEATQARLVMLLFEAADPA